MMPAAKHFDPVVGVDIHIIQPPGPVPPVPIPHPFIGFIIDPFDYAPIIGATVLINGVYRALAGTGGKCVPPHIPIGGVFVKPPANECEMFMGSSTVCVDGDAQSYMALPALSCQCIGMPPIPRLKKKGGTKSLVLPTSVVLPIPAGPPVLIGGPPTISLMALGMKIGLAALGKALKRLAKTKAFQRMMAAFKKAKQKIFKNVKPGFLKCKVLRAEPVDITTGEVVVHQQDFSIPGRIPIEWNRHYGSHSNYQGVCGYGWQTPADVRLELDDDGAVSFYDGGPGATVFESLPENGPVSELVDGAVLNQTPSSLTVRLKSGLTYEFPRFRAGAHVALADSIHDSCGNHVEFVRDKEGLKEIRDRAGRRIEVRSIGGRIYQMQLRHPEHRDPRPLVRFDYNEAGDLVAVYDTRNHAYRFDYRNHRLIRHVDRNGLSFYYEYDQSAPASRCVHAWGDGNLYNYEFQYDDTLNETCVTDSLGHRWIVELDENSLPVRESDPLGGITQFEYDAASRCCAVVDFGGLRTEYQYDSSGDLVSLVRPDGSATTTQFDEQHRPVAFTDPNGNVWKQEWNEKNLLLRQTSPSGAVTEFAYDQYGNVAKVVDPLGAETRIAWDRYGRPSAVTDAMDRTTSFTHDPVGNLLEEKDPAGRTTRYAYDATSNVIRFVRPSGREIACEYDREGNLITYRDENGFVTRYEYFGLGELARRHQADGTTVSYEYDTEERLVKVTNERGQAYHSRRDPRGLITEEIDYFGNSRRFTYDVSGNLRAIQDELGQITRFEPDALGRLHEKTLPDGTAEEFVYDHNGNLVAAKNATGAMQRKFDVENRLVEETINGFTVVNTYDKKGNRVRRETSLGNVVAYLFNSVDEVTEIRINDGPPALFERNGVGQVTSENLTPTLRRSYRYDSDGLIVEQDVRSILRPIIRRGYEYDHRTNLVRRSDEASGVDEFLYDRLDRVREHVGYGGRLRKYSYEPGGVLLHQLTGEQLTNGPSWRRAAECDGVVCEYDAAGNLVRRRAGDVVLDLQWDSNNRLISSQRGESRTDYAYDALSRRLYKGSNGSQTRFFWDGDCMLGDKTGASPAREFVYYPGTFEPLAMISSHGAVYFYHNDPNGLPCDLSDDKGEIVWSARYTATGAVDRLNVLRIDNPLRMQGQYYDDETGLHHNRYRYYDAEMAAFATKDPLGITVGENLYRLAPNVWGWIDPLGLACGPASKMDAKDRWRDKNGKFSGPPQSRGATGRTTPNNLQEQVVMRDAMGGAGTPIPGITMSDPRWPASDGWVKMRVHQGGTEVHYVKNTVTGAVDDFKFK